MPSGKVMVGMLLVAAFFLVASPFSGTSASADNVIDLGGDWDFISANGSFKGKAQVPGDIYMDLARAEQIGDPLFGQNDIDTRWVAYTNWNYTKTFVLDAQPEKAVLEFDGLDTISTIYLNEKLVGSTKNQFVQYAFDVTKFAIKGSNNLVILFASPVLTAEAEAASFKANYSHVIWPECPPDMYQGECHGNMIRKIQASFSWDWGPAFPTVGVSRPARLIITNTAQISMLTATVNPVNDQFTVRVEANVRNAMAGTRLNVLIDPLGIIRTADASSGSAFIEVNISKLAVDLWWPNGHGTQTLYTITGQLAGVANSMKKIKVGFRSVELVQDWIDENKKEKGRHFYFKVNGVPIFLKGTNWIPVSSFPAQPSNERRYRFLLDSARKVGMNSMRVWGGGRYEEDILYDLADEYGILIWEDLMFACSLYPAHPEFLDSVRQELIYNVNRLKYHPSMLLWAGNNENELGLHDGWFSGAPRETQTDEYLRLYKTTAETVIAQLDPGRAFVMSSPSEGIKSIEEGGISSDPNSEFYGDIHFYNEYIDLWSDASYRTPRCATEYGVQSWPSGYTLAKALPEKDINYMSKAMLHRQHHPGGTENNLAMIFSHFACANGTLPENLPQVCAFANTTTFMHRFAYLSQAHQAIAYKVQTEHYRRMMGQLLPDGRGNTMCGMYWQLNDIWAAPTWASVDTNLRWKMVHYEARRFFEPLHIALYIVNDALQVTVINDFHTDQSGTIEISMLTWDSNFTPVYTWETNVTIAADQATTLQPPGKLSQPMTAPEDFVFVGRWKNKKGDQIGTNSIVIPNKIYKVNLDRMGTVRISSFKQISDVEYEIGIETSGISPLTWLSVNKEFLGSFSDNGFTMVSKSVTVTLSLTETLQLAKTDISVCNLRTCGLDSQFS
ncbi:unnamed protein product, partial [Mesorhabditis belari]|uniref:beta-mannosidase n=1 Tax=Mesorhabditis belari TaxID=2138241 RepID=A0AAF3E7V7_9BILA